MRFVIFVIDDATHSGSAAEMAAIDAFNDELRANGQWVFACGIGAPGSSSVIDNRDGRDDARTGSLFAESDFYSGLWIVEADDLTHATVLAKAGSRACNRRVELRPLL